MKASGMWGEEVFQDGLFTQRIFSSLTYIFIGKITILTPLTWSLLCIM